MHGSRTAKTTIRSLLMAGNALLPAAGSVPRGLSCARASGGTALKCDLGPGKIAPGYARVLAISGVPQQ
jgi:hypothetical protein